MDNIKRLNTSIKSLQVASQVYDDLWKQASAEETLKKESSVQEELKKESSVTISGLKQASMAIYGSTYEKRGLEKKAFKALFPGLLSGVGKWAGGGAAAGGVASGLARFKQMRGLTNTPSAMRAHRAALAEQAAGRAAAKAEGKTFIPKGRTAENQKFLESIKGLKDKSFKDAPMEFIQAYGPEVARAALEGGGAAALTGAAGKIGANWMKRRKMMQAAKNVAVPAALGLGAYGILKD
jgi:hypothetical protein